MPLTVVKENAAGAPYGYAGDQWVGYDSIESIKEKVRFLTPPDLSKAFFKTRCVLIFIDKASLHRFFVLLFKYFSVLLILESFSKSGGP